MFKLLSLLRRELASGRLGEGVGKDLRLRDLLKLNGSRIL